MSIVELLILCVLCTSRLKKLQLSDPDMQNQVVVLNPYFHAVLHNQHSSNKCSTGIRKGLRIPYNSFYEENCHTKSNFGILLS